MNLDSFKKENLPQLFMCDSKYALTIYNIATDYAFPFYSEKGGWVHDVEIVNFWFKDEKTAKLLEELLNEQK